MQTNIRKSLAVLLFAAAAIACTAHSESFPFNPEQLAGDWAESYNNKPVCSADNLHFKMEIKPNEKKLNILLDRMWKLDNGETTDRYSATIISATDRTLIIRYDNETRVRKDGSLVEWELSMVAPGIYRWRETGWGEEEVNTVVGVKCSK
jgi:hypothetical protein